MDKLLPLLPGPLPIWARYALTALIAGAFFALQVMVTVLSGYSNLFLILPAVFLASVLFGRRAGFFASLLGTVLSGWLLVPDRFALSGAALPLVLLFLTGLGLAAISDAFRQALEHYRDAERAKDLLLREMAHRTKNNLATVCSLLRIQARASPDQRTHDQLMAAATRVQVMADVNDFLREAAPGRMVDMRAYLDELCTKLAGALRGTRAVAIQVQSPNVDMPAEKAVPIGIIVNELVTNSFKHAFPDSRAGTVKVSLRQDGETVVSVEDNGVGCADDIPDGLGSRLTQLMTQQLQGTLERRAVPGGCCVTLTMKT